MPIADVRGGYTVLPHVQAFADAVQQHGWADSFGTYAGHDPTPERALDTFVPVDDPDPAAAICDFAIANQARFGIWYVMSRQHIWNIERASEGWRPQSPYDRGSLTANHYDHVHVSFYETAEAPDNPTPPEVPDLDATEHDKLLFAADAIERIIRPFAPADGDLYTAAENFGAAVKAIADREAKQT